MKAECLQAIALLEEANKVIQPAPLKLPLVASSYTPNFVLLKSDPWQGTIKRYPRSKTVKHFNTCLDLPMLPPVLPTLDEETVPELEVIDNDYDSMT